MKDVTVLIQTKVKQDVAERLDKICVEYQFSSKYEIVQYLISAFLKYADPDNEPVDSDALPIELAKIFEDMQNKQEMINSVSPAVSKRYVLSEAINLYSVAGQSGTVAAKYTFGNNGDYMKTQNNGKILRTVIMRLYPSMYRKLKDICVALGNVPVDDAISYLMEHVENNIKRDALSMEIKSSFDAMRIAEKHVDVSGIVPKQTRHKDINKM